MASFPLVTRIAPTPSGFLHLGNVYNFILTWWWARSQNGKLILRIDDADTSRLRVEYVEDIFVTLEWLGMDIDQGPSGVEQF
ncbi:MAG: glutamate--tRNA ligase family protein, partial [Acidimicrobiaceae bacterium]|nr:glutamate--tRNA ligase family protein [Acidimicrobiaceae bacterium]